MVQNGRLALLKDHKKDKNRVVQQAQILSSISTVEKRIQFRRTSHAKERAGQFWIRFFAFIIDLHLVGILSIPVYFILDELGYNAEYQLLNLKYLELENIVAIVTLLTYFTLMEQSKWRASFGKMFLRLTISSTNGERLTLAKSALRNLLKLLSIGTLIGVWIIEATKQHQSLHDILAINKYGQNTF